MRGGIQVKGTAGNRTATWAIQDTLSSCSEESLRGTESGNEKREWQKPNSEMLRELSLNI